jgi:2-keto-4-pentenoate hydratase
MPTKQTLMTVLLAVTCATSANAQCLTDTQVSDLVANYVAKKPAANIEGLSDADGACTRDKVNSLLAQRLGKVVGYKAGLTNPAVQKRFNTDKPVWGKRSCSTMRDAGSAPSDVTSSCSPSAF